MPKTVEIGWRVGDGYAGAARPHTMKLDPEDFRGMDRDEILGELVGYLEEEFRQTITPELADEDEAVKTILAAVAALPPE